MTTYYQVHSTEGHGSVTVHYEHNKDADDYVIVTTLSEETRLTINEARDLLRVLDLAIRDSPY